MQAADAALPFHAARAAEIIATAARAASRSGGKVRARDWRDKLEGVALMRDRVIALTGRNGMHALLQAPWGSHAPKGPLQSAQARG